jgi:predicted Zn-dependent peptidase
MEMNEIKYPKIDETLYYEHLDNGLKLFIVPKPGFNKTYCTFVTKFGSCVNRFVPYGETDYITVPLGVAHFLEHKMFEMENGEDATNLFSNLGADANAFTDYEQTAYISTSTSRTEEVVNLLLDYVQKPFFNDENVKKEQGIIEQELMMYLDKPNSRIHLGLLQNMFSNNLVREDIVGTVESIRSITKEILYTCYDTFYHPSNMMLMIVGNVEPNEIVKIVKDNQNSKVFKPVKDIKKEFIVEENKVFHKTSKIKMDILMPKVSIGLKLPFIKYKENELLLTEVKLKMILENTFGISSLTYQEMLDKELINTGFAYSVYLDEFCGYIKINVNTNKVNEFIDFITNKLLSLAKFEMDKEEFLKMKKALIGSYIKSFNHLEFIANGFIDYKIKDNDLFSSTELLEKVNVEDLNEMRKFFVSKAICNFIIMPKSK